MEPRIKSPAISVPSVAEAMQALGRAANDAAEKAGVPPTTIGLIGLRASQINGCDEAAFAALVVAITAINAWNRLNVVSGQVADGWASQWVA